MVSREGRGTVLEDVSDGKKYLEEVMGIVEDEEFNRKRKLKASRQKQTTGRLKRAKTETEENLNDLSDSDPTWCGTKVRMTSLYLHAVKMDLQHLQKFTCFRLELEPISL